VTRIFFGLAFAASLCGALVPVRAQSSLRDPGVHPLLLVDTRTAAAKRILIDGSRDGGVWWFPAREPLDVRDPHQGKDLAEYLRKQNLGVDELMRGGTVTRGLLSRYSIVIRAGGQEPYDPAEIGAYQEFVGDGGGLLLLSNFVQPGREDMLASAFGLVVGGITQGERRVSQFVPHPVTEKVRGVDRYIGGGILRAPSYFTVIASMSKGTFLDLNVNERRDNDEPVGAPAWGVMTLGKGKVVFMSNVRTLQLVPQPLTRNVFEYLSQP
jgi:hypothetical protein